MNHIPLYLFAKAPVAGKVKTRMQPYLSEVQSAQVATALLEYAVNLVDHYWLGQPILNVSPDITHPAFNIIKNNKRWLSSVQPSLDLGERMRFALQAGIDSSGSAAVLGTDIPAVNQAILEQAYHYMCAGKNVLGACEDGGFYFLGVDRMEKALFKDIKWGGEQVCSTLLENAHRCNIQFERLPTLFDCDYIEDLQRAIKTLPDFKLVLERSGLDLTSL